jgi:hypothetical protein
MPWPSTSTIHFVPFPRLVFPTAAPLFWPTRSCHPERFRPIPAVAGDSARPATAATPPAKHPHLPTAADAASRSPRWDTRWAGRANEPRCATPRESLPHTADSMPTVGPVRRAVASAREINAQSTPTAGLSASCQQLSPMLPYRISACLEAEPIYETSCSCIPKLRALRCRVARSRCCLRCSNSAVPRSTQSCPFVTSR